MNSQSQLRQDGSCPPAIEMPPRAWHDVAEKVGDANREVAIPVYPQDGTRTPPRTASYEDMVEPPERPPILTDPHHFDRRGKREGQTSGEYVPPEHGGGARQPTHEHEERALHEHPGGMSPVGDVPWQTPIPTTSENGVLPAAPRQNQRNLTSEARAELCSRLLDYIASNEDPVANHRANGHVHGTALFLRWHRQFLNGFEQWQRLRLANADAFVPLAFWDPREPVPAEFPYQPRNTSNPSLPLPPDLGMERLAAMDFRTFSSTLEAYHNAVHDTIGGDMGDRRTSPRDPCFWLLHSYFDNIFAEWEALRPR